MAKPLTLLFLLCCVSSTALAQTQAVAKPTQTETPVAESKPPTAIPTALSEYVARPESEYGWTLNESRKQKTGVVHDVTLTSQTWHGITWKHNLHIYEPKQIRHPNHVLLFVHGGTNGRAPGQDSVGLGMLLATACGARVAALYQVPNQPLFDNRYEDDLISETWLKYLKTGDTTWPLLFPMVKSAVKAMDAVQEIAKSKWKTDVDSFVITGASKRGWTSWLTPVADKRVVGTAPMVIDTLNFRAQIRYQKENWGEFSEQILDYTSKGLVKLTNESDRERTLREMMDPWTYRSRLKLPKLIINGTNDPYWCADAVNNYWGDLEGPKYLLQLPNSGHGLQGNRPLATRTMAAFFESIASNRAFPVLDWTYDAGAASLNLKSDPKPKTVRLWTASSEDHDFRDDDWVATEVEAQGDKYTVSISSDDGLNKAVFLEASFGFPPFDYSLTTQIWRIK